MGKQGPGPNGERGRVGSPATSLNHSGGGFTADGRPMKRPRIGGGGLPDSSSSSLHHSQHRAGGHGSSGAGAGGGGGGRSGSGGGSMCVHQLPPNPATSLAMRELQEWGRNPSNQAKLADPEKLVDIVIATHDSPVGNTGPLIAAALVRLRDALKQDASSTSLALAMMVIAKKKPAIFSQPKVITWLTSLLQYKGSHMFKIKNNRVMPTLACNLLMVGLKDSTAWPEEVIYIYLGDMLGERVWSCADDNQIFVQNVETAFTSAAADAAANAAAAAAAAAARAAPATPAYSAGSPSHVSAASPAGSDEWEEEEMTGAGGSDDDWGEEEIITPGEDVGGGGGLAASTAAATTAPTTSGIPGGGGGGSAAAMDVDVPDVPDVRPRFSPAIKAKAAKLVVRASSEFLQQSRALSDSIRGLLKVLTTASAIPDVRLLASRHLQPFLNHPGDGKLALEMLSSIAAGATDKTPQAREVVNNCIKVRLTIKSQSLTKQYLECMEKLLRANRDHCFQAFDTIVKLELKPEPAAPGQSAKSNPTHAPLLDLCLRIGGQDASQILGFIFQDSLAEPMDTKVVLKALLQKVVGTAGFHGLVFVQALTKMRELPQFRNLFPEARERMIAHTSEIVALVCIGGISKEAVDAARVAAGSDGKGWSKQKLPAAVMEAKKVVSQIQTEVAGWLQKQDQVPQFIPPKAKPYLYVLRNVLFLSPAAAYFGKTDEYLTDSEKLAFHIARSDTIVSEDLIVRMLTMGITPHPLPPQEALAMLFELVRRAARPQLAGEGTLVVSNVQVMDALLKLSVFKATVRLPEHYDPPLLAMPKMYWQSWHLLLMLCACNPTTLGAHGWAQYPTLMTMMELCITGRHVQTLSDDPTAATGKSMTPAGERQAATIERDEIFQLEIEMAKASGQAAPTMETSRRIGQLCSFDPAGRCRAMPRGCLDELARLNAMWGLGVVLCKNRSPDFLLEVLKRAGPEKAMSWLVPLVDAVPDILDGLPVAALCEMALQGIPTTSGGSSSLTKRGRRSMDVMVKTARQSGEQTRDIALFFCRRLYAVDAADRRKAWQMLSMLVAALNSTAADAADVPGEATADTADTWFLEGFPKLPDFATWSSAVCDALCKAMRITTELGTMSTFCYFVCKHAVQMKDPARQQETVETVCHVLSGRAAARRHLMQDTRCRLELYMLFERFLPTACRRRPDPKDAVGGGLSIPLRDPSQCLQLTKVLLDGLMHFLAASPMNNPATGDATSRVTKLVFSDAQNHGISIVGKHIQALASNGLAMAMARSGSDALVACVMHKTRIPMLIDIAVGFGVPTKLVGRALGRLDQAAREAPQAFKTLAPRKAGQLLRKVTIVRRMGIKVGDALEQLLAKIAASGGGAAAGRPDVSAPAGSAMSIGDSDGEWDEEEVDGGSLDDDASMDVDGGAAAAANGGDPLAAATAAARAAARAQIASVTPQTWNGPAPDKSAGPQQAPAILDKLFDNGSTVDVLASETAAMFSLLQTDLRSAAAEQAGTANASSSSSSSSQPTAQAARVHVVAKLKSSQTFLEGIVRRCGYSCPILRLLCISERRAGASELPLHCALADLQRKPEAAESASSAFHALLAECQHQLNLAASGSSKSSESSSSSAVGSISMEALLESLSQVDAAAVGIKSAAVQSSAMVRSFLASPPPALTAAAAGGAAAGDGVGSWEMARDVLIACRKLQCSLYEPVLARLVGSVTTAAGSTGGEHLVTGLLEDALEAAGNQPGAVGQPALQTLGLLVDWIVILNPSIIAANAGGAGGGRGTGGGSKAAASSKQSWSCTNPRLRYLLGVFIEAASWPELRAHLRSMLKAKFYGGGDSTLDCALACLRHPRLWLGSKEAGKGRGVFMPTTGELVLMAKQIVMEMSLARTAAHAGAVLNARIPVLLYGAAKEPALAALIKGVEALAVSELAPEAAASAAAVVSQRTRLVLALRLSSPRLSRFAASAATATAAAASAGNVGAGGDGAALMAAAVSDTSSLDVLLHKLIIALLDVRAEDSHKFALHENRSVTAFRIFRNLAAVQPLRILKSIPAIAAMMSGRAQTGREKFLLDGGDVAFTHVLGIAEALRPAIFAPANAATLDGMLVPFWQLAEMTAYDRDPRLVGTLDAFLKFLRAFMVANPEAARAALVPKLDVLSAIDSSYPEIHGRPLLSAIENASPGAAALSDGFTAAHISGFRESLRAEAGVSRAIAALRNLDKSSASEPQVLVHFADELSGLLKSTELLARDLAYRLISRLMKHSPASAAGFSPPFLRSLRSEDHGIRASALEHAPEFFLAAPGSNAELLRQMFTLATDGAGVDITPALKQVLKVIHLS